MNYKDFFHQFGASYRIKNIARPWLFRRGRGNSLPTIWGRFQKRLNSQSSRKFQLPAASKLPFGFISLCPWEGEYLFSVARRSRVGIVEIGRLKGGSTFLMACAAPDVPIYSVDCAPQNDERLQQLFKETGVGANVSLIVGDSQHGQFPSIGPYDMLFIDGDHSYNGVTADIANWYSGL